VTPAARRRAIDTGRPSAARRQPWARARGYDLRQLAQQCEAPRRRPTSFPNACTASHPCVRGPSAATPRPRTAAPSARHAPADRSRR
jgi:hypothetical protein